MQKKIIRVIAGATYYAHTEPIFKHLRVLKLTDIYKMQVSKYVLNFLHNVLPSPLSKLFTLSRTVHEHSTLHCTTLKLQTLPSQTVITSQCIANMGPRTWNLLSSELYTNSAHQTLIHISGFSSRFWRAVIREHSDWLIYYLYSPVFPWVGLGEACGWVWCFSVAMYDHVSRVFCPVLLYVHYYLYLLLSKL